MRFRCVASAIAAIGLLAAAQAAAAPPVVLSTSPTSNSMAPASTPISLSFDQALMTSTVTANELPRLRQADGQGHRHAELLEREQTVTFTPSKAFAAGELVLVNLSHDVRAADNIPLRAAGYAFQFLIRTASALRSFDQVQSMSNRTGSETRIYGAAAADLNGDGYIDLTTVNEVSADLRVFMNSGDGSGHVQGLPAPPVRDRSRVEPERDGGLRRRRQDRPRRVGHRRRRRVDRARRRQRHVRELADRSHRQRAARRRRARRRRRRRPRHRRCGRRATTRWRCC